MADTETGVGMKSLGMKGSFNLTKEEIDRRVIEGSRGNYAIGYFWKGAFYVKYIGRSDKDLNRELKGWAGQYSKFKFSYADSPKTAFDKECFNYHDFGETKKLINEDHPKRPEGTGWQCPVCDYYA